MSVVIGLTPEQQVEFDLILSGMVDPAEAKKISKSIFEEASNGGKKPFKVVPENPKFMSVDSGIEVNIKVSDITAFFSEGEHLKIIIEKLEIDAAGTIAQFKSFMESHIDEWGSF